MVSSNSPGAPTFQLNEASDREIRLLPTPGLFFDRVLTSVAKMATMALQPRQSIEYQESHLYQNHTRDLTAFYILCIILAAAAMVMRVLARMIKSSKLEKDDWTFLAGATLGQASFIVLMIYSCAAGLGAHWVSLTPDQKLLFPKLNYAYNILNVTSFPVIKISILLFYYRIFVTRGFRHFCLAGIVFISAQCISNTLVAVFACHPIRSFWDLSVPGKCISAVPFYIATAVLNITTDVYILILPIRSVWQLHTTTKNKIAISAIFMFGGLTFVLGIFRIVCYFDYSVEDPSYSFLRSAYASPAEVCLAIVVASAPTWRPLWISTRKGTTSLYRRLTLNSSTSQTVDSRGRAGSITVVDPGNLDKEAHMWVEGLDRKSSTTLGDSMASSIDNEGVRDPSPRGAQAV